MGEETAQDPPFLPHGLQALLRSVGHVGADVMYRNARSMSV